MKLSPLKKSLENRQKLVQMLWKMISTLPWFQDSWSRPTQLKTRVTRKRTRKLQQERRQSRRKQKVSCGGGFASNGSSYSSDSHSCSLLVWVICLSQITPAKSLTRLWKRIMKAQVVHFNCWKSGWLYCFLAQLAHSSKQLCLDSLEKELVTHWENACSTQWSTKILSSMTQIGPVSWSPESALTHRLFKKDLQPQWPNLWRNSVK